MLRRQSAINLFIKSFSVRPLRSTFHKTPYCSFRNKKMPNLFHFVLLSVVGCCLVSLNLRFDCTLALRLSKKTVFRDFSRISSGEHQFLFSQANYFRCIISFTFLLASTKCFLERNFVSTHSSNHKAGNGSSLVSLIKQLCFASLQTDMAFHQLQYHSLF